MVPLLNGLPSNVPCDGAARWVLRSRLRAAQARGAVGRRSTPRAVRDYTILSLIAVPGLVPLPRPHWVNSWTLPLTPPICRRWPALAAGAATRAATVLIAAIADILLLNSSIRGAGGRFFKAF